MLAIRRLTFARAANPLLFPIVILFRRFCPFCCIGMAALLPSRPVVAEGADPSPRKALLADWGKYDPSIRQAYLQKQAAAQSRPNPTPAPDKLDSSAGPVTPAPAKGSVFILPKMTVEGSRDKPLAPLPRLHLAEPAKNLEAEPFESREARRARLVQKHFTAFEQALGRIKLPLLSQPLEDRAGHLEAAENAVRQLNSLADLLELYAQLGLDSPEEQRTLRAEFLKLYYGRPR